MAKADDLKAKIGLGGPPLVRIDTAPPAIPDHQMVRRIGSGSYGDVWLARSAVGTWRAVKVVYRAQFKDTRPYEREFSGIQKYEPISRTNEGLVDVLQIGRNDAEGYFYYVMELADDAGPVVSGPSSVLSGPKPPFNPEAYVPKTLGRELQQRGRLPIEECITLGLTLNLALGHLHRSGLIHRDVKPSNIIFVNGVAKLADIGLVTKWAEAQSFVGTEGFIPPEGPNSPQADIFALGKVLYEASMGKDRHEFPEPASDLGTDVESRALMELNAVLLKACAPNPKQRYHSAEEMNADLALLHSGVSVQQKHVLQRRVKVLTRVGVALGAVIILGALPYYLAIKEARLATAAAKKEFKQRQKSDQVAKLLTDMLKAAGPSVARGRDATLLREILDNTAEHVKQQLKAQPEVQGDLYLILSKTYADIGDYPHAITNSQHSVDSYIFALGDQNPKLALALGQLGSFESFAGNVESGKNHARLGLAIARKCRDPETLATCLANMGISFNTLAQISSQGTPFLREAVALRKQLDNTSVALADYTRCLAASLDDDKSEEPVQLAREAFTLHRQYLGPQHPKVATDAFLLGQLLLNRGQLAEAEKALRETVDLERKLFDKNHPWQIIVLKILVNALTLQDKSNEAEGLIRQAAEASPSYSEYWFYLAGWSGCQGRWTSVEEAISRAIELSPTNEAFLATKAALLLETGRYDEYRHHCHNFLELVATGGDFAGANTAAKAALLLPVNGADFERACELADFAATAPRIRRLDPSAYLCKSLVEYRRAHYDSANDWSNRAISDEQATPGCKAAAWFIQAWVAASRQEAELARTALANGDELVNRPRITPRDPEHGWQDWTIAAYLRREAVKKGQTRG